MNGVDDYYAVYITIWIKLLQAGMQHYPIVYERLDNLRRELEDKKLDMDK